MIEILIVVAIMGVLISMALPAYQNSVIRSGRAEAKNELLQVASDQERHYSTFNTYVADATPLTTPTVNERTRTTINALYSIEVETCATGTIANCFIATATALDDQTADLCATLTITSTGLRGATGVGATTDECWQR